MTTPAQLDQLAGAASWQARVHAWRLRVRARRQERRRQAATVALAAVSRLPGVTTAGRTLAAVCALLGLAAGLLLALAVTRSTVQLG